MKIVLRQWQAVLFGAALALLASLLALFWLDKGSEDAQRPWFYNAAGYQQASNQAQQDGKPLLIWLVSRQCQLCPQREQELWPNAGSASRLNGWQMVRLEQEADPATAQLLESFIAPGDKLPLLILEAKPQGERQKVQFDPSLQHFRLVGTAANWRPLSLGGLAQLLTSYQQAQLESQSP